MALDEQIRLESDSGRLPETISSKDHCRQRTRRKRPLREIAITIYVSMALLLLAIPQSVSDRLADFPSNALVDGAKWAVAIVADIADLTGLPRIYEVTRRGFLQALGRNRRHRSGS